MATRALIAPGCAQVIRPSPWACGGLATTLAMRARRRAGSTSALCASPQRIRACPVTPSCQLGPLPGTCSRGATVAEAAIREAPDRIQSWLWNRASAPPSARLNQDYPATTAAGTVRPGGRDTSGRAVGQRCGPWPGRRGRALATSAGTSAGRLATAAHLPLRAGFGLRAFRFVGSTSRRKVTFLYSTHPGIPGLHSLRKSKHRSSS